MVSAFILEGKEIGMIGRLKGERKDRNRDYLELFLGINERDQTHRTDVGTYVEIQCMCTIPVRQDGFANSSFCAADHRAIDTTHPTHQANCGDKLVGYRFAHELKSLSAKKLPRPPRRPP